MAGKEKSYLPVPQLEDEESSPRASSEVSTLIAAHEPKAPKDRIDRHLDSRWVHWIAHAGLTVALVVSVLTSGFRSLEVKSSVASMLPSSSDPFIRASESFYDGIDDLAKTHSFYFDKDPHPDPSQKPWKGHPNDDNERLWSTLNSVGFVSISAEEARRMGLTTARNIQDPDRYVVTPHVYHDVHCVQMLRDIFWQAIDGTLVMDATMRHNVGHYDHCFHSLRQSLTCTADLSPLTWEWSFEKQRYDVLWDSVRQCRNWDNIMEWATSRNSTGMLPTKVPDKNTTAERLEELRSTGMKLPWDL